MFDWNSAQLLKLLVSISLIPGYCCWHEKYNIFFDIGKMRIVASVMLIILGASPSFGFENLRTLDSLPPMPGPDFRAIGWEWHFIDENGTPGLMRKTEGTSVNASYWRNDGCTWTRNKSGFAPALQWDNCPTSGLSEYKRYGDPIWPLVVGKKFGYKGTAVNSLNNKKKKFNRRCEVTKIVRIKTNAGEFDTFVVVCKDRWVKRSWWLSANVGTAVVYKQRNLLGESLFQEMVRIVFPVTKK